MKTSIKTKIFNWFKHSETIFLARIQMFVGTALGVLAVTEPSLFHGLVGEKWFPLFLIGHGILAEYLRKRRAPDLK